MPDAIKSAVDDLMKGVIALNPNEPEFHQAVREVAESVMPLVLGSRRYRDEKILERVLFAPAKAANAGGVAVSGLEQTQNSMRLTWSREEVDDRLKQIMLGIHGTCVQHGGERDGFVNYVQGANRGGFVKMAEAMLAYGVM